MYAFSFSLFDHVWSTACRATLLWFMLLWLVAAPAPAQTRQPTRQSADTSSNSGRVPWLVDRGPGMATSMFATYVRPGELLLYPFFEHYRDRDFEYKPSEFGGVGDRDFRGRFRANEALFFVAYGISDRLAVEAEVATVRAVFRKAADDPSAIPDEIRESGLGDVEGQIRWRWRKESDRRPEVFSYAEAVIPHHRDRPLTGTSGLELKFGTGVTRGLPWGTWTARAAVQYAAGSASHVDLGEYAVEYVKRLSPAWRIYAGVEGTQDEVSAVTEAQWHVSRHAFVRVNSGFGLSSKATDWAPEIGVVFAFGGR